MSSGIRGNRTLLVHNILPYHDQYLANNPEDEQSRANVDHYLRRFTPEFFKMAGRVDSKEEKELKGYWEKYQITPSPFPKTDYAHWKADFHGDILRAQPRT